MSGMEPMLIGAALGGGISAARGGNPLTGALLGGLGGSVAGAAMPSLQGGIGNLINGIGTNAAAGGNVAKGLAINASLLGGSQAAAPAAMIASQPAASYAGAQLGSQVAAPSFLSSIGNAANWIQQNPSTALQGAQLAKNTFMPEQQPMQQVQPVGLMRGTQMQQQAPAYAMARPNISLI